MDAPHIFNPWWGCTKVSPGCAHCYAETLSNRWAPGIWGPGKSRRTFPEKHWNEPLHWNEAAKEAAERRRCFCGSMCDWAEDGAPEGELEKLWPLIRKTPWLDWLLLTKRPEKIKERLPKDWDGDLVLPNEHRASRRYFNVWMGTSIENKDYIWRAGELIKIPCAAHFISAEPLLGSLQELSLDHIEWVIVGAESGADFREMKVEWARELRDKCLDTTQTAFFFKQSSGRFSGMNPVLDEKTWHEFPWTEMNHIVKGRLPFKRAV